MSPFDRVADIYKKDSSFSDDGYVQFIINKELSKNPELVGLVANLSKYNLPNRVHFKYLNSYAKLKRKPPYNQFPWIWKKNKEVDENVSLLARHLEESIQNCTEYYSILNQSSEGKSYIKQLRAMYGME